jgi:hypothetical protein
VFKVKLRKNKNKLFNKSRPNEWVNTNSLVIFFCLIKIICKADEWKKGEKENKKLARRKNRMKKCGKKYIFPFFRTFHGNSLYKRRVNKQWRKMKKPTEKQQKKLTGIFKSVLITKCLNGFCCLLIFLSGRELKSKTNYLLVNNSVLCGNKELGSWIGF